MLIRNAACNRGQRLFRQPTHAVTASENAKTSAPVDRIASVKQRRSASMEFFSGLDVSIDETAICVVDDRGRCIFRPRLRPIRRRSWTKSPREITRTTWIGSCLRSPTPSVRRPSRISLAGRTSRPRTTPNRTRLNDHGFSHRGCLAVAPIASTTREPAQAIGLVHEIRRPERARAFSRTAWSAPASRST